MTAPNTPQPGRTVVPSARAERKRIRLDDATGIAAYAIAAAVICLLVIGIVALA